MNKFIAMLAASSTLALAGAAHASGVDGALSLNEYAGGSHVHVGYDPSPGAPNSNFGSPTNTSDTTSYDIYLRAEGGQVYGLLLAAGEESIIGSFANLYFDIDPANANGSDIGFELAGDHTNFFVPGSQADGYGFPIAVTGITTAISGNGLGFEFAIPNAFFASYVPGVQYYPGQQLPGAGDKITLRLSQSFSYSVAGGASYGADRLGSVNLAAVPEPATWGLMLLGFFGMGAALRNRRRSAFA